jgi:hypothetical protein
MLHTDRCIMIAIESQRGFFMHTREDILRLTELASCAG